MNEGLYLIDIPQADRLGHEAHFSKVAEAFLGYLHDKNMPEWETRIQYLNIILPLQL